MAIRHLYLVIYFGYLFMRLRSAAQALSPVPLASSSDSEESSYADLGDGSSDDDDEWSSSSDDDFDNAPEPQPADEDDATVAQWRRNSYSDATLVLLFLPSISSYKVSHVEFRVKQLEPSMLWRSGIGTIQIALLSVHYGSLLAGVVWMA